jgi:hypothetical protein
MAVIPAAARAVYSPPLLNEKQQKTEKLSFLVFHGVSCAFICFHMFSLFFSMCCEEVVPLSEFSKLSELSELNGLA